MPPQTMRAPQSELDEIPDTMRPSHPEVAARAYELYLERGATDGHDTEDWLQAVSELVTAVRQKLAAI